MEDLANFESHLYFTHFIDMKAMTQSHLCSLKMS